MNDKAPIDFWFDFSSPYGYLLSECIDTVAARHGRQVRWHPILLGVIFQSTGSHPPAGDDSAKARYITRDFHHSARFMGVPYRPPSRFPLPTQAAARAYYWLHDRDGALARQFAHAVYRAFFVADRDISAPNTVLDLAAALGAEDGQIREQLAAAIQSPELKARLKEACDAALAAGVFGSPHVRIDGEAFFGADRLPQIERWLETGGF
ncbi:MAG: 2-hydroxychromene-2-carboxylate isomerase [Betaproteobacteria bacterium]|nr:2-hydroxychromene-2-carboxylate isomerase [Betaproteobacteria bacterium]